MHRVGCRSKRTIDRLLGWHGNHSPGLSRTSGQEHQHRVPLDVAVFDTNNKLIDNDKSNNGLGIVTIKKNETGKKKVNFISYSRNKDVVQNMTVYFSP